MSTLVEIETIYILHKIRLRVHAVGPHDVADCSQGGAIVVPRVRSCIQKIRERHQE